MIRHKETSHEKSSLNWQIISFSDTSLKERRKWCFGFYKHHTWWNMIVAIHQPNLFPRLKILQKLALADVWVVLDNVQYCQREYQNRTLIVPRGGRPFWHTMPVHLPFGQSTNINDAKFASYDAVDRVNQMLKYNFIQDEQNSYYRRQIVSEMSSYKDDFTKCIVSSTTTLLNIAGACPKITYASQLGDVQVGKNERLIDLCKAVGGDTYIADSGGTHYIDEKKFKDNEMAILWQVWEPPQNENAFWLKDTIRNGSSLNLLMRSSKDFIEAVAQSKISKKRIYAEGR